MAAPSDRRYSDSHEWHKVEGGLVVLGVTQFAVDQLTDITYVQMKPAGTTVKKGDSLGEVESVKATSDIYSGVAGEVVEVNAALSDNPALLNTDPYSGGWLVKIRPTSASEVDALLSAADYNAKYAG
jgi:glycine cleavage system H protein